MAKVERLEINSAAAIQILNSGPVQALCLSKAQAIANSANAAAGGGYAADVQAGKTRAHALAKTINAKGMRDNAKNNTLLKSLGSGR